MLDGRILEASRIIEAAPDSVLNAAFRDAWQARLRRWEGTRAQCSDYMSRQWGWKWGPVLDSWEQNQAEWEAKVQARTGQVIPVAKPLDRPSDETLTTAIQQAARFPDLRKSMRAVGIGAGVILGAAVIVYAWRKGG